MTMYVLIICMPTQTVLFLRIEIHILSLHWMMKNISIIMSVKPEVLLGNIKIANVFHHPMQA